MMESVYLGENQTMISEAVPVLKEPKVIERPNTVVYAEKVNENVGDHTLSVTNFTTMN